MKKIKVKVEGKKYQVEVIELKSGNLKLNIEGKEYIIDPKDVMNDKEINLDAPKPNKKTITAPLPGIISEIKVKSGQKITKGTVLIKIIAMKMENEITAKTDCKIKQINIKQNDKVNKGDILLILE